MTQQLVNTQKPGAIRTFMILDSARGEAHLVSYSNGEALEVFGPDVMATINRGERAIHNNRKQRCLNHVVFDVVLAAIKANEDLFDRGQIRHVINMG